MKARVVIRKFWNRLVFKINFTYNNQERNLLKFRDLSTGAGCRGVVGVEHPPPPTGVQVKVGGFWRKISQRGKNPKIFRQNEYKTQNFKPAASNFSGTASTHMYVAKINVFGSIRHTLHIYWSVPREYPAPAHSTCCLSCISIQHPLIGSSWIHPLIGSSWIHPLIGSSWIHPLIGSSWIHPSKSLVTALNG